MSIPPPKATERQADLLNRRRAILARIGSGVFAPDAAALCEVVIGCLDLPSESQPGDTLSRCRRVLEGAGEEAARDAGMAPSAVWKTFLARVLGFHRVPADRRENLRTETDADIKALEALIARDSSVKAVQEHLRGEKPRDHESRMVVEFYRRCVETKNNLDDFANSIDDLAVSESTIEHYYTHRYDLLIYGARLPIADHRVIGTFDRLQIDRCGHRVDDLPVKESDELEELYRSDAIDEFYERLGRRIPPAGVFRFALDAIARHRELDARRACIEELQKLWDLELWLGFHALAILQVEGLFADMISLLGERPLMKALPDKVSRVRPHYPWATASFDYYQWIVPLVRNSFAHTGREESPQRKSKDDLYDLHFLFSVLSNLDAPLVRIRKLFDEADLRQRFRLPNAFTTFFTLLEGVPASNSPEMEDYRRRVLEEADIPPVVSDVVNAAREATNRLVTDFERHAGTNLVTIDKKDLALQKDAVGVRLEEYQKLYFQHDQLDRVGAAREFIEGFLKHLPGAPSAILAELRAARSEHREVWSRLDLLRRGERAARC
jgi:hypothetical protein